MRTATARVFAAHGYVDPSYRPPRLPYVSVVGPLALHVEPERENGKTGQARVRLPGYVVGKVLDAAATVPATGNLQLRFDGLASVTLALAGLPTTPFGDAATGPAVALAISTAIAQALALGQFKNLDGLPLTDPALLSALHDIAVRWSAQTRQLAVSSDAGGDATLQRSTVEVLAAVNDLAPALGLAPPSISSPGRQKLHRLPAPRSMTVDVRLDLWAHNQTDMAAMFDGLANAAPTRGRLVLRPSLLAGNVGGGATQVQLLERGEPTTPDSLVHLEGGDGFTDRARDVVFAPVAGASLDTASARFVLAGTAQITGPIWSLPMIPDPLFSTQPAPAGFAVAVGIALDAAAAVGDRYVVLSLGRAGIDVFTLAMTIVSATVPGDAGPTLFGETVATATLTNGGASAAAKTTWRIPLAQLQAGGTLHATVFADAGAIVLAWEGEHQRLDDTTVTPVPPSLAPGEPTTGADMVLALGGGATAALPRPIAISHVHIQSEPFGPLDPKVRSSISGAARLRPGDMIGLASSLDGWHIGETKSLALVDSISGSTVTLTRPASGAFARGQTIAFQDECFFFQTAVKRRDDLMNRLYHCSVDYRVSALLEDPTARSSTTLVLEHQEDITARGSSRASVGHPGVTAVDADLVRN